MGGSERACSRVPMEHSFLCGQPAGTTKPGRALGEKRMAWMSGFGGKPFLRYSRVRFIAYHRFFGRRAA